MMKKQLIILTFIALTFALARPAWGDTMVNGSVYEQDGISPISGASVVFSGIDLMGDTIVYQLLTDNLGHYEETIGLGSYQVFAFAEGYETVFLADPLVIEAGTPTQNIDFILHELPYPVRYVAARHFDNELVRISWSLHDPLLSEDFETGNFSRIRWNNTLSNHPWAIDSIHAYEGNYCMKSNCEGVSGGISQIEAYVYLPRAGQMRFYSKVSSENPWDMGQFYIDGVKKMECTGEEDWQEHLFDVTEGEHLFRWTYVKDASTNQGDDCFYVDDIHFLQEDSTRCAKPQRTFQYYDLFRSRYNETPVTLASHLTDTVFMEMNWSHLPWGRYRWGVSCHYEGNRSVSDTIWSMFLDKDMTTTLEVFATTNIGVLPEGAVVTLSAVDGQGQSYQTTLDANGYVFLSNVYRDLYTLRVHLDGFEDYVSPDSVSIFAPTQLQIELMEAVHGVDSLYVSSTGWAIWQWEGNRDLQYFELMLDSVFVGTTTASFFQFNVSDLVDGDTCLAQVRPVYLSDTCAWRSHEWVYRPCSDFQGSVDGLRWTLHNEALQLSWDYPADENLLGAVLYRDGEYLGFTDENAYLDETVTLHGEVEYCLRLVYDGDMDGTYYAMSCEECSTASFPAYCDPPVKLDGETYFENESDYGALISWGERPDPIHQWLQYDNGEFKRALGGDNEPIIFWSIRFEAEDLEEYVGTSLKKVALFDVAAGTYQMWIYTGGETAPQTLVRSQNLILNGIHDWHEEDITPAFEIPENEPIWIVIGQQGLNRPAAACADMGNPNGRWVSLDGETWTDMHTYNMHYTWMLRAFVTNRAGRSVALEDDNYTLQQYNLYRSYDNTDYQQIASIPVLDGQLFYEYRDPLIDNTNEYVYYRLSALYLSEDGETCESDYAAALNNPEQNYVVIDLLSTEERIPSTLKLYPNPSNGLVSIELKGMQSIMVFNALGQKLHEEKVFADLFQLHLSGLENGLYWLQVTTQNSVFTQPFVLSR